MADNRAAQFEHAILDCGAEFAADVLAQRQTVSLNVRVLSGAAHEPEAYCGLAGIVERCLSKGTKQRDGRALADAFDALGIEWGSTAGRQSTLVRALCLPEFAEAALDLIAELLTQPTFPDDACRVAVQLAQEELRHLEDEPQGLLQMDMQRLALGPVLGRHVGGTAESLARITPPVIREHWKSQFAAGRLQISVAGPVDPQRLRARIERNFAAFGAAELKGREVLGAALAPARHHRAKDLKQQYMGISLAGAARSDAHFAVEQVLLGVLAGGMGARLFTELREKQGLVYWVSAWHEQPRGRGVLHMGASTTPERCQTTYDTLLRELGRLADDVTREEVTRARESLVAHALTEDDLTRARAGVISDDLFHFGVPRGPEPRIAAVRAVTHAQVREYAARLPRDRVCVATVGPVELS